MTILCWFTILLLKRMYLYCIEICLDMGAQQIKKKVVQLGRGGTMYRFCPRIVVSWHLRRPQTRFRTRFQTCSQTHFRTRFHFQHFPEPRQNLVSVFLIIFSFSPVFFLFLVFFSPVFPVFSPVFLVFRWKMMHLISYRFPFLAANSPRIPYRFPFLAENSPRIPYRFPFLAENSPRIASFSKNWSRPPLQLGTKMEKEKWAFSKFI